MLAVLWWSRPADRIRGGHDLPWGGRHRLGTPTDRPRTRRCRPASPTSPPRVRCWCLRRSRGCCNRPPAPNSRGVSAPRWSGRSPTAASSGQPVWSHIAEVRDCFAVVESRSPASARRAPRSDTAHSITLLVILMVVALLLPIGVFVATASRFGSEQRNRRLAALRLLGLDRAGTARVAAGESLLGAVVGVIIGVIGFLADPAPTRSAHGYRRCERVRTGRAALRCRWRRWPWSWCRWPRSHSRSWGCDRSLSSHLASAVAAARRGAAWPGVCARRCLDFYSSLGSSGRAADWPPPTGEIEASAGDHLCADRSLRPAAVVRRGGCDARRPR